jgi:hypothetical protein
VFQDLEKYAVLFFSGRFSPWRKCTHSHLPSGFHAFVIVLGEFFTTTFFASVSFPNTFVIRVV